MQPGKDYIGVTVSFLCHDGKGNYLFNKRSNNCRDEHGRWDCGGGRLEFGDSPETTLKREIQEEYCTEVKSFKFLGVRDVHREHEGQSTHWISLDYKVLVNRDQVKNGEPHKFDEIGWFKLDALPSPLHSQFSLAVEQYQEFL